ncbi:MAG: MBG domain-containing protein, partial [Verrucomicrobiales bacterium]|nr:MBG domain-containing protein [Verrucomicrobiales bacterium]
VLVIAKSNAVVVLSDLSHVYDGTAKSASASTVPPGLNVVLTYDGSPNAPTNVGSYTVVGTIVELNYQGSATNTLVISPAATPFPITFIGFTNGIVTLTWDAISNRTYRVQYVTNVGDTNWTDIAPDVTATGPSASLTNAVGSDPRRFYRVLLLP